MARATRIALDIALVSLTKIRPVVAKAWGATKSALVKTPVKPLVSNVVVSKVEIAFDRMAEILQSVITNLRNKQLPREEKYLEQQLDKVRQKMSSDNSRDSERRSTGKELKPMLSTMWQYAKVEMIPPMSSGFFHGPAGKSLENKISQSADGFIAGIENKIKDMENAELQAKKEKEAALKAAEEKVKAAAKAKEQERKRIEEEKRKVAETEAKAKAEAKAKEEPKKTETKEAKPSKSKSEPVVAQKGQKEESKKKPTVKK